MEDRFASGSGLLVLIGAGASYDCLPNGFREPGWELMVPPLTKDLARPTGLARSLNLNYPDATPVLNYLRERLGPQASNVGSDTAANTLEQALADYRGISDTRNVPRHIMAMRFFLRDLLWSATENVVRTTGGDTNYTTLVRKCFNWAEDRGGHVCFVNFNYDPLLEFSCRNHFRLQPATPDQYVSADPAASLLKPHGSVLWRWPHPNFMDRIYPKPMSPEHSIDAGEPDTRTSANWEIHGSVAPHNDAPINVGAHQTVVPVIPAMALPITEKSFVWPRSHQQFLSQLPIDTFGRILVVGWRAAEPHFLPLLRPLVHASSHTKIHVVTGGANRHLAETEAAEATARIVDATNGISQFGIEVGGFSGMFNDSFDQFLS